LSTLEIIVLGLIQGVAEFFPLSSSGHLKLGHMLFGDGLPVDYLIFGIVLHFGTLLAMIVGLFAKIKALFQDNRVTLLQIMIATLPLLLVVLFLGAIKTVMNSGICLGLCFMVTGGLLFIGEKMGSSVIRKPKFWRDSFVIGIFQAMSVLPGLSRLGATVSTARCLGWSRREAVVFSLLLSLPAIIGAMIVELCSVLRSPSLQEPSIALYQYLIGFMIAFGVGSVALRGVLKFIEKRNFIGFGWYCLLLGAIVLLWASMFN